MSASNFAELPAPSSRAGATSQVVPVSHRGAMVAFAHERLAKALGPRRAGEVMHQVLGGFDERLLDTPQDLLDIAERLIRQGGLVQAVGRSLKVHALLRGAVER